MHAVWGSGKIIGVPGFEALASVIRDDLLIHRTDETRDRGAVCNMCRGTGRDSVLGLATAERFIAGSQGEGMGADCINHIICQSYFSLSLCNV